MRRLQNNFTPLVFQYLLTHSVLILTATTECFALVMNTSKRKNFASSVNNKNEHVLYPWAVLSCRMCIVLRKHIRRKHAALPGKQNTWRHLASPACIAIAHCTWFWNTSFPGIFHIAGHPLFMSIEITNVLGNEYKYTIPCFRRKGWLVWCWIMPCERLMMWILRVLRAEHYIVHGISTNACLKINHHLSPSLPFSETRVLFLGF